MSVLHCRSKRHCWGGSPWPRKMARTAAWPSRSACEGPWQWGRFCGQDEAPAQPALHKKCPCHLDAGVSCRPTGPSPRSVGQSAEPRAGDGGSPGRRRREEAGAREAPREGVVDLLLLRVALDAFQSAMQGPYAPPPLPGACCWARTLTQFPGVWMEPPLSPSQPACGWRSGPRGQAELGPWVWAIDGSEGEGQEEQVGCGTLWASSGKSLGNSAGAETALPSCHMEVPAATCFQGPSSYEQATVAFLQLP